ncbi:MAG: hypothetical protein BGN89_12375 [Alphaproteobacteria bacterium 64-6]|nr:hypothetical protein [Hyphomicrobium sp.]OJU28423.1 MAG: hypothetical protein BGN89_12375 [Alphaproteobacteria bacterium 64-6]
MKIAISCAFALVFFSLASEASAQSSCSGFFSQCQSRCKANAADAETCIARICRPKLAACRKSGCYQETARFGGANHCNLKKS